MTVYDEVVGALDSDPAIAILYAGLSEGDHSILIAMIETDEGIGATTSDSPNARFWHRLAEYGWMIEVDSPLPDIMSNYRITDRGYRAIPALMNRLVKGASG